MKLKKHQKEGLVLMSKGIGIGACGASMQAVTAIGASVLWQIPLIIGFGTLTYSGGKQMYKYYFKKD